MNIILTNASTVLTDEEVSAVASALQAQANADLVPAWRLAPVSLTFASKADVVTTVGDALIVVLDDSDQAEALGYHDLTSDGKPLAKVFAKSCANAGEDWRTCVSHELCEMLCDPNINCKIVTNYNGKTVTTIQEVCDPVEGDTYVIAGVPVSNFVLPAFYDALPRAGEKYDFLGRLRAPMTMSPGGYMSFEDDTGAWTQVFGEHVTTWRATPPIGSRRERLRAGRHRWRRSTAV